MFASNVQLDATTASGAAESSFVSRNACTAIGCGIVGTVPALGTVAMVMGATGTTAMLTAIGGTAIYVGHRQHVGKPIMPKFGKQDDKSATDKPSAVAEAPAPAAAAA